MGVEESIRAAQDAGAFDDLPGKGKPLRIDDSGGDWGLAFHMLKSAGHAPDWIERGAAIARAEQALRAALEQTGGWARAALDECLALPPAQAAARRTEVAAALRQKADAARAEVTQLNRAIESYNLSKPPAAVPKVRLDAERILARAFDGLAY